jgi:hypothetical protein
MFHFQNGRNIEGVSNAPEFFGNILLYGMTTMP